MDVSGQESAVYRPVIERTRLEIWKKITANRASMATVAIMDRGRIVYAEGFGMRDRAKSLPVNPATQFNVGSISKLFTAAAILTLVDQGKIEMDVPATLYLPEFRTADSRYGKITVRMLLNHTSGLPGSGPRNMFGTRPYTGYGRETLAFLAFNPLKHDPGVINVYCNDGFTLAEMIVSRISGMSFANYLSKHIFRPLGMLRTSCYFMPGDRNIARSYGRDGCPQPVEYANAMGSGGISSTAVDLCRFSEILYSHEVLSAASLAEFIRPQYTPATAVGEEPFYKFGLGWDSIAEKRFADQGIQVLGKSGGTFQFSSRFIVAPEYHMTVALIFVGPRPVEADDPAAESLQALLEAKKIVRHHSPSVSGFDVKPAKIPERFLKFKGYYARINLILKVSFDTTGNTVMLKRWIRGGFMPYKSLFYGEDGFFRDKKGDRFRFKTYKGRTYLLTVMGEGKKAAYELLAEGVPTPAEIYDAAFFGNARWLVRNERNFDFVMELAETEIIPELPGYFVFRLCKGIQVLCVLTSPTTTGLPLRHARDQMALKLTRINGVRWLETGSFRYSEAKGILPLDGKGAAVIIGEEGLNEWRKIGSEQAFSSLIPEGGRVVAFNGRHQCVYDSLYGEQDKVFIGEEGGYVCFIGKRGSRFEIR